MHLTAERLEQLNRSLELALNQEWPQLLEEGDLRNWLKTNLEGEIQTLLSQQKTRSGYATLAGVNRPVRVLRQTQIKLEKGKSLRPEQVEVSERI